MSYQLKKVRLLSYKLHAAFTPSAHFRPKKAPRAIFSRGGGRVYFGVNGQFLCLGGPSYGHWKTMRVVLKNFFDLTPLSPYPIQVSDTVIATLSDTQHRKGFKILNEMMMYVQLYIVHHTMKYYECCEEEINCTLMVQTRAYAAF